MGGGRPEQARPPGRAGKEHQPDDAEAGPDQATPTGDGRRTCRAPLRCIAGNEWFDLRLAGDGRNAKQRPAAGNTLELDFT